MRRQARLWWHDTWHHGCCSSGCLIPVPGKGKEGGQARLGSLIFSFMGLLKGIQREQCKPPIFVLLMAVAGLMGLTASGHIFT